MNISRDSPLDTAVDGRCQFKGYNYHLEDSTFSDNSNSIASNRDNIRRYSRTKLFDLRNGSQSRRRPESDIRAELQSLGVWKFNNGGNVHQNSVNTNSEGANMSNNVSGINHSLHLSAHLTVRSQRSPSRRDPNAVNISNSSSQHNLLHHNLHKTYIDHRSISSSHLMPAFAKRRIAASNASTSNLSGAGFQNLPGSGNLGYDPNSPVDARSQTPTDIKEVLNINVINSSSNGHVRQRTKDQLYDYRHRGYSDGHNTYLSPQRKVIEHEQDRDLELQSNNGPLSSPVTLGSSRQSGISNERRIGSGRLLPRDVNWDYHTSQDRDKNQNLSNVATTEKEIIGSNSLIHFRGGVRYSDRQHDRIAAVNGYVDRRPLERKSGGGDENVREKYEYMGNAQSPNSHGSSTRRDIYGVDSSLSQHTTHNRNRRNHQYNDKNEEPEWFSSGPTSQHDTIELRGFEEIDDHYKGNASGANGNLRRSNFSSFRKISEIPLSRTGSILNLSKSREQLQESPEQERERIPCVNVSPINLSCIKNKSDINEEEKSKLHDKGDNSENTNFATFTRSKSTIDSTLEDLLEKEGTSGKLNNTKINARETDFNFDVFLNPNLDPLKHTLMRGDNSNGGECDAIGASRFSRWFANKTVTNDTKISSGRSNVGDNTALQLVSSESKNEANTLMEFLNKLPHIQDCGINQKTITSVEELEARMREINAVNEISSETEEASQDIQRKKEEQRALEIFVPVHNDQLITGQPPAGEVEAFKKLLEQLGSENKQIQQQHIQLQQHVPPNLQMNVMLSEQNRSAPIPPLNIMQPAILPPTPRPQQLVLKNDELKKVVHPQAFRQQLPNNADINNMSHSQHVHLSMFGNHPQKRLEAHNFYQCIQRGEISINFLEQELNNPNTSLQAKEAIAAILRDYCNVSHNQQNSKTGPTGQQQHSPIPLCNSSGTPTQNHCALNSLNEQLPQQQLLSQVSNANVMLQGQTDRALLLPTHQSLNHLAIPSQRDIQFHTHTIMQNAVMKKKIEEQQLQQDSHRRRQEIQKQSQPNNMLLGPNEPDIQQKNINLSINMQQPPSGTQQHISHPMQHQQPHINSPTPLAFTPTSVLRKMTAEKDNVVIQQQNKTIAQNTCINFNTNQQNMQQPIVTQPRMILGGNHSQHPQQMNSSNQLPPQSLAQAAQSQHMQPLRNSIAPMKWPIHLVNQNMPSSKPMGRPILKGPLPPQSCSQHHQPHQQISQLSQMMFNKLDFQQIQQQQRIKTTQSSQHVLNQPTPPFSQHTQQTSGHTNIMSQVHQQQLYQQQRVLAMQRHQQQQFHLQQQLQHQQHPPLDAPNRNICMQSPMTSDNNIATNNATAAAAVSIINYQRDGGLSPTSNQLAQWFSPELLAQASAGKLPLLNMNQALSLEEFERNMQHSSATAHN